MEEWNINNLPEEENRQGPEQPMQETPAQEEPVPEQEQSTPEQPTQEQPPQWQAPYQNAGQGGYTYQNPNPYQYVGGYPYGVAPKKKKNTAVIVVAAIAAGLMLICCGLIAAAMIFGFNGSVELPKDESGVIAGFGNKNEEKTEQDSQGGNAQRDEDAVYNMPEITTEEKSGDELTIAQINKKVKNSVVGVLVTSKEGEESAFSGSGFIISEDGYIMTNDHVVEGALQVRVMLSDGITEYDAVIVGEDERSDIAILKVDATGLTAAELGNSDGLEVGETVVAIGNPYGLELFGTVTDGIVSALNRKIAVNGSFMTLIQTNASINPGNSGGPLVNAYGQVIGVTSSKLVATDFEGIGFAIPINAAASITEELITYGYIKTRAYIGIQGSDLTKAYAEYHGLPQGVYVAYVDPKCDAAAKGLKEGDVIVGFNGKEITSMAELNDLKDSYHPGDTVTISVWREGKNAEISITLTEASQ